MFESSTTEKIVNIKEFLNKPFQFFKEEIFEFRELISLRNEVLNEFNNSYNNLQNVKNRLYKEGKIEKWGISTQYAIEYPSLVNQEYLSKKENEKFAKDLMCHESALILGNQRDMYAYCNTKVHCEWENLRYWIGFDFLTNFRKFSERLENSNKEEICE